MRSAPTPTCASPFDCKIAPTPLTSWDATNLRRSRGASQGGRCSVSGRARRSCSRRPTAPASTAWRTTTDCAFVSPPSVPDVTEHRSAAEASASELAVLTRSIRAAASLCDVAPPFRPWLEPLASRLPASPVRRFGRPRRRAGCATPVRPALGARCWQPGADRLARVRHDDGRAHAPRRRRTGDPLLRRRCSRRRVVRRHRRAAQLRRGRRTPRRRAADAPRPLPGRRVGPPTGRPSGAPPADHPRHRRPRRLAVRRFRAGRRRRPRPVVAGAHRRSGGRDPHRRDDRASWGGDAHCIGGAAAALVVPRRRSDRMRQPRHPRRGGAPTDPRAHRDRREPARGAARHRDAASGWRCVGSGGAAGCHRHARRRHRRSIAAPFLVPRHHDRAVDRRRLRHARPVVPRGSRRRVRRCRRSGTQRAQHGVAPPHHRMARRAP